MSRRVTKALLLALCCTGALRGLATELPTVPLFRFGVIADSIGSANLVPADLTGDGRPEIISCSNGSPFALEYRSGAYQQLWYGPAVGCSGVAAGDVDGDGATEVIVTDNGVRLRIFDPRSRGAARATVVLPGPGYDVAFGNVDFDAAPEIVVTAQSATYVYDARTLALQWTASGHGGTAVFIADVDGDARNEIVVSNGSILDGGNEVLKWSYAGGFPQLAVGNVDADAKAEILFAAFFTTTVKVLNGDTMTTSNVTGTSTVEKLGVGDADGDGVNEVIVGGSQIRGRRPADSTLAWSIENPESGCMAVAVADVDADGVREVLWGAGIGSSGPDGLFVGNPLTHAIEWESSDLDGPFSVAAGDLDGDGRLELVVVTYRSENGYSGSVMKIFDALTGAEEREIGGGYSYADRVIIAQLDNDPAMEIAVGYSSTIRVFDGVTGAVDWTSPGVIGRLVIANVDADPTDEIITTYQDKLIVMHGISNIVQSSRDFGDYVYPLAAGDVTGDGVPEIVAASYETPTKLFLLSSTLETLAEKPVSEPAAAAVTPEEGGRIAVVTGGGNDVVLFDKTLTQQWSCFDSDDFGPVAFGTVAGQFRVLTGNEAGVLRAIPLAIPAVGSNACPDFDSKNIGAQLWSLASADVTGDGRAEIIAGSWNAAEIALIGLPGETRGDVNGDAVIAENDIDQLIDYLFGAAPGLSTTGDANADEHLSGEDAFALIHYEFGGGTLPD